MLVLHPRAVGRRAVAAGSRLPVGARASLRGRRRSPAGRSLRTRRMTPGGTFRAARRADRRPADVAGDPATEAGRPSGSGGGSAAWHLARRAARPRGAGARALPGSGGLLAETREGPVARHALAAVRRRRLTELSRRAAGERAAPTPAPDPSRPPVLPGERNRSTRACRSPSSQTSAAATRSSCSSGWTWTASRAGSATGGCFRRAGRGMPVEGSG